jgi:hypothetical protein
MFRRENKNLGNLRGAVQTWLNSYARLNTEAKKANRNAPIDPTTLRGNVGLIKSIRKYVALKTLMNQLPAAPAPGPIPLPPQVNKAAVNTQLQRFERNIKTTLSMQAEAVNKLAQLTRIQAGLGQMRNKAPSNLLSKINQVNRSITAARNSLGTPRGAALVKQAAANLVKVANDPKLGEIFKTPQGGLLARGFQGNATGRILMNSYYKVMNIGGGQLRWSANNKAYNYNRNTGNIRPKMAPALPLKPDEYTNSLLKMYPNSILNSLNKNKLVNVRTQLASRPDFNRPNVGNKILAIQRAINKKNAENEEVFSRL